jgi:hypothetical protein
MGVGDGVLNDGQEDLDLITFALEGCRRLSEGNNGYITHQACTL